MSAKDLQPKLTVGHYAGPTVCLNKGQINSFKSKLL